jgi:hypothetical protein
MVDKFILREQAGLKIEGSRDKSVREALWLKRSDYLILLPCSFNAVVYYSQIFHL